MPSWSALLDKIDAAENPLDATRRRYLRIMNQYTDRNVIAYYSAFIQKPDETGTQIDDNDKNAFMQAVYGLDQSKGLDLILHTPGGSIAATESLVEYLKKIFGNDIRVFVPQIAMSAGTMISLSAKEIIMGKQSNLGPIDPQYGGISCAGIIEEFDTALKEIKDNPEAATLWSLIIGKYHPTFIGDCKKAVQWSKEITKNWLCENMFSSFRDKEEKAQRVIDTLSNHAGTYSHARHIHMDELMNLGLKITRLEGMDQREIGDCKDLQDCVLTIHHAYMQSLSVSNAVKIVENHEGNAMIITGGNEGQVE